MTSAGGAGVGQIRRRGIKKEEKERKKERAQISGSKLSSAYSRDAIRFCQIEKLAESFNCVIVDSNEKSFNTPSVCLIFHLL